MSVTQHCLFLLVFSAICGGIALDGLRTGVVRAGNWGFRAYRPSRDANPLAFWFFVGAYGLLSASLAIYSLARYLKQG